MLAPTSHTVLNLKMKSMLLPIMVLGMTLGLDWGAQAQQLRQWLGEADIVGVATATSIQEATGTSLPFRSPLPFKNLVAGFTLKSVFKGGAEGAEIPLRFFQLDRAALVQRYPNGIGFSGPMPFGGIEAQKSYLIFAKKEQGTERYVLINGLQGHPSLIEVGLPLSVVGNENPPLLRIAMQLAASLNGTDSRRQAEALAYLADFSDLMQIPTPRQGAESTPEEKEAFALQAYIRQNILPRIQALGASPDPEVKPLAVLCLGAFQIPEAIPQLLTLANQEADMAGMYLQKVSEYRVASAVSALTILLSDKKPAVVVSAVAALGNIGQRSSLLPMAQLLVWADNAETQYAAVKALFSISGEKPPVAYDSFLKAAEIRKSYVDYWQNWLAAHPAG